MSYILYNVDNRTVHTYSQERPTYYGYDFVFIAGIGVGLLIYKTFFLPASLQQQQQQLQLQQLEEKKKQQEEEDKRQQQQTQQHQQLQQPHKQQPREDSMIKYLKGALVKKLPKLLQIAEFNIYIAIGYALVVFSLLKAVHKILHIQLLINRTF